MDITAITQFINGVGFPIVACVAMAFFIYKDRNSHNKMEETLQNLVMEVARLCLDEKEEEVK